MGQQIFWAYCVADEAYFEAPGRMDDGATRFAIADRAAPDG